MKKITITCWRGHIRGIKYKQNEEKNYTGRALLAIIRYVHKQNYSVMIQPTDSGVTVLIDDGMFIKGGPRYLDENSAA